jgi:hypothetical protein
MSNTEAGRLTEVISTFTYRNKGSIRIPKEKREKAYTMAVDVFVDIISYNAYLNTKSEPDYSFFGYATLVFQDSIAPEIPLKFGRNRLYYARNNEALSQWEYHRQFYAMDSQLLFLFTASGGSSDNWLSGFPPIPKFIELPLREVYVECQFQTQFRIEYSQYEPQPYTNDRGLTYTGISTQVDGDKDTGLPENGTAPNSADDPLNPFNGADPVSTNGELGGFNNNDKLASVNNSNPDTAPSEVFPTVCGGSVKTYTTAPESPVGILANTFTFSNISVNSDQTFQVESWNDAASFTGKFYGIKLVPSGVWFNGTSFQSTRFTWSQRDTRIEATCTVA